MESTFDLESNNAGCQSFVLSLIKLYHFGPEKYERNYPLMLEKLRKLYDARIRYIKANKVELPNVLVVELGPMFKEAAWSGQRVPYEDIRKVLEKWGYIPSSGESNPQPPKSTDRRLEDSPATPGSSTQDSDHALEHSLNISPTAPSYKRKRAPSLVDGAVASKPMAASDDEVVILPKPPKKSRIPPKEEDEKKKDAWKNVIEMKEKQVEQKDAPRKVTEDGQNAARRRQALAEKPPPASIFSPKTMLGTAAVGKSKSLTANDNSKIKAKANKGTPDEGKRTDINGPDLPPSGRSSKYSNSQPSDNNRTFTVFGDCSYCSKAGIDCVFSSSVVLSPHLQDGSKLSCNACRVKKRKCEGGATKAGLTLNTPLGEYKSQLTSSDSDSGNGAVPSSVGDLLVMIFKQNRALKDRVDKLIQRMDDLAA